MKRLEIENSRFARLWLRSSGCCAVMIITLSFIGCEKKTGEAVVLGKEHIAAKETSKDEQTAAQQKSDPSEDEKIAGREKEDITVDGYVMSADVRGTSRDPRASNDEQWIVKVRTLGECRQFNIQADRPQFERLKDGDRVKVTYRIGKYTRTVWGSEIK